jgi:hypothetical protein
VFLAAGISADTYVVLGMVTDSKVAAAGYAVASFALLVGFWYAVPLMARWTSAARRA